MAKTRSRNGKVSGYFRQLYEAHPDWLEQKSNDMVLEQYRKDNNLAPDAEIPQKVKYAMANVKTSMRKKKKGAPGIISTISPVASRPGNAGQGRNRLDNLEEMIDDCLTYAKNMNNEQLGEVIRLLRNARNSVVLLIG